MFEEVYITLTIMVGIGLLFGTILTVAYKKMKVYEDPRIDRVEEMLPSANCGACGVPGCRVFSEKVVNNEMNVGKCTVSSPSGIKKIADFLGIEANSEEKRVARLLCGGGIVEAQNMAEYRGGIQTCRGEAVVSGGPKECNWGCLGLADCAEVCDFNAIVMNDNGLPVVIPELCTACNDCVEVCPKGLFEIMPINQRLIVQCKSLLEGDEALSKCSVACNACNRCVADAQQDVISIQQNLAVINYELNEWADTAATKRCPTGAIVWLNGEAQFENSTSNDLLPLGRVEVNLLNVN